MRSSTGQFTRRDLGSEITTLKAEIAAAENSAPPLEEVLGNARRELEQAEALFRTHGLTVIGATAAEQAQLGRRQIVGALMTINSEALIAAEAARLTRQVEADPRLRLSATDKATRLAELRPALRRLLAARELEWRAAEDGTEIADPEDRDPGLFLATHEDLVAIAQGEGVPT